LRVVYGTPTAHLKELERKQMEIGKPQREIYVEPLELPEPLRETPSEKPEGVPEREPEKVPT
jgi:hypothetical protein